MKELTKINGVPLKGGCVTVRDKALLPMGAFAMMQNLRNTHPGMEQRLGQRRLHTTADSTNKVLTLYQFKKTNTAERHFYAQMGDGDVLEATNNPPTVTSGNFGSEVFSGAASGQIPASWGNIGDVMIFSNGKDQHQIYGGTLSPVERFIVFRGAAAPADVPQGGEDFSDHVVSSDDGRVAILDSLGDYSTDYDCIFIRTPVPCNGFGITLATGKGNASASTVSVYYWKNDHSWATVGTVTDGTAATGATLAQNGSMTWTLPTDIMAKYAFGSCGWWYQVRFSADLDSEVELSAVTYQSPWQSLVNVWYGATQYAVEVRLEGTSTYEVYASGAVDMDAFASGKKLYVAFTDPVEGIYLDPQATPSTSGNTIASLKYWDGAAWTTVGTFTDGSTGLSQAGWCTFPRCPAQPLQFQTSLYQAYWYEITWTNTLAADTVVAIQGMPYFDIADFGMGYTNAVWKDRACYSFDRWGSYIYVSARDAPMVLNGLDYGILKAGDGRANRVVAQRRFHNELMVWQEELGVEGGCVTLFEGYSPSTFGKIVLSSQIGGMNAKAVAIVDGVMTATKTEETIKTLAFFLSRYGVCACDGMTITIISDDIGNYFDPTQPECIRYGYEKEMWLDHDPVYNVLRIGLVTGDSATVPNVFPVFDLTTKTWSFDTPAQELACITQVEPGSGQGAIVVVGGGVADGYVYQTNYGMKDVTLPIRAQLSQVINYKAMVIALREILVRMAAQGAGAVALSLYLNETLKWTKQLSMVPERAQDSSRRHRLSIDVTGDLMTLEFSHSSTTHGVKLYETGVNTQLWERR